MSYLSLETSPKEKTSSDSIAPGSIKIRHLSPEVFLELQLIKFHNHLGTNSPKLSRNATPDALAGFQPFERVEHDISTWTGGASASGSIAITFGNAFKAAPTVIATVSGRSSADMQVTTNTPTTTGVTIYWKLDSGTATEVTLNWIALGR